MWGLKMSTVPYSASTIELVKEKLVDARRTFRKENESKLEDFHFSGMYAGGRFSDDSKIIWSLESNVEETDLLQNIPHFLNEILEGACRTDYYYNFEKEW